MSIAVELPGHVVANVGDGAARGRTIYRTVYGGRSRRSCARANLRYGRTPVESAAASQWRSTSFRSGQSGQSGQSAQRAALVPAPHALVAPHVKPAVRMPDVRQPTRAADPQATQAVRLTHRGQGASLVVAALLALAVVAGSWASQRAHAPATSVPTPAHVAVMSGDTLWSIAGRVAPGRDPRAEVDDLLKLNDLTDAGLEPGQLLRVR